MKIGLINFQGDIAITVNRKSHLFWINTFGAIPVETAYPQEEVDYIHGHVKIVGVDGYDD